MEFKIGDIVKYCSYNSHIRSLRDHWLLEGNYSKKEMKKERYEKELSKRGTILNIEKLQYGFGLSIKWDDGTLSQSWDSIISKV